MPRHYSFNDALRGDLLRWGVVDEQVHELEVSALPAVAHTMRTVRVEAIRKPLEEIHKQADRLAKRLDTFSNYRADSAAQMAAAILWEEHSGKLAEDHLAAPLELYPDNPTPDKLAAEIRRLANLAERSLGRLKGKQARRHDASPWPIRAIDEALLRGWGMKYYSLVKSYSDEELRAGKYDGKPTPPYPFAPRASGAFREIVVCCYAAAGHPNPDPDNAIEAFIALKKRREAFFLELVKDDSPEN